MSEKLNNENDNQYPKNKNCKVYMKKIIYLNFKILKNIILNFLI